jgi:hypothetical protein
MVLKKPIVVAMQKDGGGDKLNMNYIQKGLCDLIESTLHFKEFHTFKIVLQNQCVPQLVPCQQLWLGKF